MSTCTPHVCSPHIIRSEEQLPGCEAHTYRAITIPCPTHANDRITCQAFTNLTSCSSHVAKPSTETDVMDVKVYCPNYTVFSMPSTYVWDDPTVQLSTSTKIKTTHFNQLKAAIATELSRRSASWPTTPANVTSSIKVQGTQVKRLRDGLTAAVNADGIPKITWTVPSILQDAALVAGEDKVTVAQIKELRRVTEQLETDCVCNCNYCTCQCNECTCVCNYGCTCNCNYSCTCECNYCTCVCHYDCTCNCNYSSGSVCECVTNTPQDK